MNTCAQALDNDHDLTPRRAVESWGQTLEDLEEGMLKLPSFQCFDTFLMSFSGVIGFTLTLVFVGFHILGLVVTLPRPLPLFQRSTLNSDDIPRA